MSEITELSARVANLEAWVEAVMRTLAGMQVEPVLIELDEARARSRPRVCTYRALHAPVH
jgi:hypothetical protein